MTTMDTIKDVLHDNLSIDPDTVNEDSTFTSLNIDSLDLVELLCDLEDRCHTDLGDPEGLTTVGDLVTYIEKLQA
jgi:acyl carrier protein